MARSSCTSAAVPVPVPSPPYFWAPPREWGWPPGGDSNDNGDGVSPASSPEGGSLSPCSPARRGRLGAAQRRSASQREKLRMRRLAQALHTLRRFLPPSVAPAGRSLTKVETLRLASRYIAHLSRLLRPADAPPTPTAPGAPAGAELCGCASPPDGPAAAAAQDLPAELLAFLDAWLPPTAQA